MMTPQLPVIENQCCRVQLIGEAACLWHYQVQPGGRTYDVGAPAWEVGREVLPAALDGLHASAEPQLLPNGGTEYRFAGNLRADPRLGLELIFRLAPDSPVVRFRYVLHSRRRTRLTKSAGADSLRYLTLSAAEASRVTEVRLSEFDEMFHTYVPSELPVEARAFSDRQRVMGPILVWEEEGHAALAAYEHGSTTPIAFLEYRLSPDRSAELCAAKGNYYAGQPLTPQQPYETIWLDFAAVSGGERALASAFRRFLLCYQAPYSASRQPYLFYNTWGFQERNQWWNRRGFWGDMNLERTLQEIEVAHRMGIEVYVIDTGWYGKCGEWEVHPENFPDGLRQVKAKLDGYGMKLGLWFSPDLIAVGTDYHKSHRDCLVSWQGKIGKPREVWGTPASQHFCLVSRWADTFAQELIRLVQELGVTYFKWDAISQYLCDAAGHGHGEEQNSLQERADCHAFLLPQALARIVAQVSETCPEAIVDFDVTEVGRCVGLGFLGAGKYFLINNGPYYFNYEFPQPEGEWSNLFVRPGPTRARVCRRPLPYDKWLPSVLFLTHYLPDDPESSQIENLASLILGQNGIWGDLLTVSKPGVRLIGKVAALYKQVREDLTAADPVTRGALAGSPEIHEKILPATGRGALVTFTCFPGDYEYVTESRVDPRHWATDGVQVTLDPQGRAVVRMRFDRPGAKLVFFGVD